MPTPTLKERQEFWLWSYANHCFSHFSAACDFFLKHTKDNLPESIERLVIAGAVTTYARPFTKWEGVGKLDPSIVPRKYRSIHSELMDLRHMLIAHVDAVRFQADDPTFGNLNQVRLTLTKANYEVSVTDCAASFPRPKEAKSVAEYLNKEIVRRLNSFGTKFLERSGLPLGDYQLSLNPAEARAFVPAVPLAQYRSFFKRN